jgi:hypothetical protein
MLSGVPQRDLLQLVHRPLDVQSGATSPRFRPGEQQALPVLVVVKIEGFTEAQSEYLEVRVGSLIQLPVQQKDGSYLHRPMPRRRRSSAWHCFVSLNKPRQTIRRSLQHHRPLSCALGTHDEVISPRMFPTENAINERLFVPVKIGRSIHARELQRRVLTIV